MKNIYLASDSKARKALLEIFGLKFSVISSGAREKKRPTANSVAELVKKNARAKAEAATKKIKSGMVIAADTVVVDGRKIFGKPRDLKDARRMLKRLSGKPQWIYSGVCVLDKDTGRKSVSCEKTRIFMDPLTDKEITAYFKLVSPLDKAGSFDIQGKGAFFIRRIEGCYYNVVGLPLRRLYRMLAEMGIKVFSIFLVSVCLCGLVSLTGCATEYNIVTGEQESFYYSTEKEVNLGRSMARQIEKQYKLDPDPLVQERAARIGERIAAVCDRKDISYTFKVLEEKEVNAVSLPGGFVYVNRGLVDKVASDAELAAVLAHEVGHIVARHSIKRLQGISSYSLAQLATILISQSPEVATAADVAFTQLLLGFSREDELLADQLGARYTRLAGYDPRGMITFLEKLQEHNRRKPLQPRSYFKTHPYVPDRIRVVKQEIGEPISFTDYINIDDKARR